MNEVFSTGLCYDMLVTAGLTVAVVVLLCTTALLWLRERELVPTRVISPLRRRPLAELAVIAVIVGGFVQYGATKGNGELRMEDVELRHEGAMSALRSQEDASDLRFAAIEPCTNGVALAIVLPTGGVMDDTLDLFCTTNLLSQWSLLDEVDVAPSTATAEVFVAMADMPESPTSMPSAAFFAAGTHDDSDGDGLYDGRELRLHGTDPLRADTDGDGLSDGAEVAAGTYPLLRDTDGDGYPDDEEAAASTNPLVADVGASGTIRYVYDADDRLAAAYVGAGGGASLTTWSPSGDPSASAERLAAE